MLSRRVASKAVANARFVHVPAATPLGAGKVRKLNFEYLKPVYVVPSWMKYATVLTVCNYLNFLPTYFMAIFVAIAVKGGFSGNYPPDPHDLYN